MKVLLINPPYAIERYMGRHLARVGWVMPPMGLLYVAGGLEQAGIAVEVYDAQADGRSLEEVLRSSAPDVVGITCTTALVTSGLHAASLVKKHDPRIPVVVGGVHPTVRPDEILGDPSVDLAVRGEGERTMVEVVEALAAGRSLEGVEGVSYCDGDRVIHNPPRRLERNPDNLPWPARHLVPMHVYKMSPDWSVRRPFDLVFTTFGCPFRCMFCAAQTVSGGSYRRRSIGSVMAELDDVVARYGIRSLLLGDDSFASSRDHAMELCEAYVSRGYHRRIPWFVSTRVDSVDREILQAMKRAGCGLVSFGIESGVQRLLDRIGKKITLEQSVRAVRLAKEAGLRVRATFILGIPGETHDESLETIRFSRTLPVDQVRFALATPFPGTDLWRIAEEEGTLKVDDWMNLSLMGGYRQGQLAWVPKGRDADELKRLQRRANLGFFLHPRAMLEYLTRIRTPADVAEYALGAWELVRASMLRERAG